MTLKGYFDGHKIVLVDPPPPELAPNTPVKVVLEEDGRDAFDQIAAMAIRTDLPVDFATQHEHYIKGTPRK